MRNIVDVRSFIGTVQGDQAHMLGKFLYFSLANLLVEKEALSKLCDDLNIPCSVSKRLSVADAFRSATGDIRERVPVTTMGETNIYLAYCRDNKRADNVLSRELVKETLNRQTNQYEKLANISYDKRDNVFRCENLVPDADIDVCGCCRRAEDLFELYQVCANRKHVETICASYLRSLETTKLSITGHMYFVPRTHMEGVDVFEDFITLLSGLNKNGTPLMVNSFYIIDDEKQRSRMTEEFYAAVKKEIAAYQERADYLIKSGSQSPAVMDRWVLKIQSLEEKKKHYEQVLRQELDGLDDEFATLKFLSQELQVRAQNILLFCLSLLSFFKKRPPQSSSLELWGGLSWVKNDAFLQNIWYTGLGLVKNTQPVKQQCHPTSYGSAATGPPACRAMRPVLKCVDVPPL